MGAWGRRGVAKQQRTEGTCCAQCLQGAQTCPRVMLSAGAVHCSDTPAALLGMNAPHSTPAQRNAACRHPPSLHSREAGRQEGTQEVAGGILCHLCTVCDCVDAAKERGARAAVFIVRMCTCVSVCVLRYERRAGGFPHLVQASVQRGVPDPRLQAAAANAAPANGAGQWAWPELSAATGGSRMTCMCVFRSLWCGLSMRMEAHRTSP